MADYDDPRKKKQGFFERLGGATAATVGVAKRREMAKAEALGSGARLVRDAAASFSRGYGEVANPPAPLPEQNPLGHVGNQYGYERQAPGYGVVRSGAAPSVIQPAQPTAATPTAATPVSKVDMTAEPDVNTMRTSDGRVITVGTDGSIGGQRSGKGSFNVLPGNQVAQKMAGMATEGTLSRPLQAQQSQQGQPQMERTLRPHSRGTGIAPDEAERRASAAFSNARDAARNTNLTRSQRAALAQVNLAEAQHWAGGGLDQRIDEQNRGQQEAGKQRNLAREQFGSNERTAQMGLDAAQENRKAYGGQSRPIAMGDGTLGYIDENNQIVPYTNPDGTPVKAPNEQGQKALDNIRADLEKDSRALFESVDFMPGATPEQRLAASKDRAMKSRRGVIVSDDGPPMVQINGEWVPL